MKRLLWKEAREQWPFALAVLAMPPLLLLLERAVARERDVWPVYQDDLWLLYTLLAVWGAVLMPRERARGRLTLETLPAARWQVWVVKAWPGLVAAILSTGIAMALGRFGGPFENIGHQEVTWPVAAGGAALGFSAAFAASLVFGPVPSGLLGFALAICGPGIEDLFEGQPDYTGLRLGLVLMALAAAFLALALWLMVARQDVADRASGRWIVSTAAACVLGLALWPAFGKGYLPGFFTIQFAITDGAPTVLVSRRLGMVAHKEEGWIREAADGPDKPKRITGRYSALWVRRLDGEEARRVALIRKAAFDPFNPRPGDVTIIGWLADGRLLYALPERDALTWQLWSPQTQRSRQVTSTEAPMTTNPLTQSFASVEPGGTRAAALRPPIGKVLPSPHLDLWLLDLDTGDWSLRWPGVAGENVVWRRDRLYITGAAGVWSLDPDGGRPRREHGLPTEEVER